MTTRFFNDQSFIIDSPHLASLRKKFGLTQTEIDQRKGWIDIGYFRLNYAVLFSNVEQTDKSMFQLARLLKTIKYAPRHLMSRMEYIEFAQKAIDFCLLCCNAGFFTREVDPLKFHRLSFQIDEMLKDLDCA